MFALTPRLTLRPGWPEDAPALAAAIGHHAVVHRLARVPWPYGVEDAAWFLGQPRGPADPCFLIWTREPAPRLVGGIAIVSEAGEHQLGYWLAPDAWGRGYATEAGRAVVTIARHALPIARLSAYHHADNPASGRVLAKLGFRRTGTARRPALARGGLVDSVLYELDLADAPPAPMPIAA